jgi:O-antigen/teichoic acid export membrane protein
MASPTPDAGDATSQRVDQGGGERVSRSATFALAAQLVGGLLTAVLTIFLGRALSASQFGSFTFALGVITIATLFVDVGIASASGRFIAERRDQPAAAAAVFRTSLRLKLITGIPATVALLVLARPICEAFGTGGATWALRGCAIALLAQTLFNLFLGAFIALGKLRYNVVLAAVESVAEVSASIPLVVLSGTAAAASFGRAIGFAVGLLAAIVLARKTFDGGARRGRRAALDGDPGVSGRQILSYAGPLLLVDAAFRVFGSIDVLLIAAILGGGARIAAFGLPLRLTLFLEYPAAAVASAVAPRLTQRHTVDDVVLLAQSMRYLAIMQMLVTVPLLIWPEAIMHLLFGDKYAEAPEVLRALAPFVLLSGVAQLTTLTVNFLGEAWRRVPVAVLMLAANVIIDIVLLPRIGIVAGAIGTSVAYAVWVPAHVWILRKRGGLPVRPFLLTLARCTLAGGAMLGVLALLGTGRVSIPVMLLGGVAGTSVYVAVLFALGELGRGDIAVARRLLPRRGLV